MFFNEALRLVYLIQIIIGAAKGDCILPNGAKLLFSESVSKPFIFLKKKIQEALRNVQFLQLNLSLALDTFAFFRSWILKSQEVSKSRGSGIQT